jgi:CubicO group peptidase (beta-lactamase class C family)
MRQIFSNTINPGKMKTKPVFLFLFLAFAISLNAYSQRVNSFSNRIDSLMNALYANNKAMASLTITKNGKVEYSKAFGFIDNQGVNPVNATPETRYRIGSISKMFTTVMIMQLIGENKLSLSTPLSKFFNKVPNADSITIAELLNHHSGLYNFTNSEDYVKYMTEPKNRQQMLGIIENQKPAFKPGQKGEYSNTNFVLLGYIIEDITGKSYQQNLSERITSQIGLKNTMYGSKINHAANEASSFEFADGKWKMLPETDMSIPGGAGAVISTTPDLNTFINALFDGKLISESSLKEMMTMKDGYGMGMIKFPFYDRIAYGHNGGIDGFSSSLAYFPEDKVAIAFCSNGLNYGMNNILIGILSCYFNKPYTIPDFKSIALSTDKLTTYEGDYTSKQLPITITVKRDGDQLTAQATGQSAFPLDVVSETEFRFDKAGVVMIFDVSPDGNVTGFTLKQGANYVFTRAAKP